VNRLETRTIGTVDFSVTAIAFFVYWIGLGPTNAATATQASPASTAPSGSVHDEGLLMSTS
jgi:hypothetical protein